MAGLGEVVEALVLLQRCVTGEELRSAPVQEGPRGTSGSQRLHLCQRVQGEAVLSSRGIRALPGTNQVRYTQKCSCFCHSVGTTSQLFCPSYIRQGLLVDRRSEPRMGERVPYVIVYGTPSQPLIQLVRRPEDLLDNPGLRLNGVYYITKQLVPALERCFSLLGVDVRQW